MNKYFNINQTLHEIISDYPCTTEAFEQIGFDVTGDKKEMGKKITLKMALTIKNIDEIEFEEELVQRIEKNAKDQASKIRIQGVLPCPVKIPLLEALTDWVRENKMEEKLEYELQAASMGLDWLVDAIHSNKAEETIADVFISAGFDLFFDKSLMGKLKDKGVFEDVSGFKRLNKDFENEEINLRDPKGHYTIIATVPAVFLVNTEELKGRKAPTTWEDILSKEFENSVSLPVGDFDLFNAILLNIYRKYGEEGVKNLGRSMMIDMHPSEMVKSHRKPVRPAVTIMPFFFTKMTKQGGPMQAVWPADGAIISPIFLLSKKNKAKEVKPVVDFFTSSHIAEILSYNGKFPSTRPDFDNMLSKDHKYMWIGWDYIEQQDISSVIKKCEALFEEGRQ